MPSYTVYTAAAALTCAQRAELAESITALHSEHTGAPRSFVQTIFLLVPADAYFIGAEPADPGRYGLTCGSASAKMAGCALPRP